MICNTPSPVEVPIFPASVHHSQNPLYIHPFENLVIPLVNSVLDGKNYHSWSRSMKKAVITKLCFLDGSSLMPNEYDPTYEAWVCCNNLVLSWIQNFVAASIAQSIVYYDLASSTWLDLKTRFSRADRVRIANLRRELYAFCQDTFSAKDYFTKLSGIWEELEVFRSISICTCLARYQCEGIYNARKLKQEDPVIIFLTGLNDHYAVVRSQILIMEPFPDLNTIFSMIIQHESFNGLEDVEDTQIELNLAD
jgi:hypothetical protein